MVPSSARQADRDRAQVARAAQGGQRGDRQDRAADRQRQAARDGDDAVGPDDHARGREAVDHQDERHGGKRAAGDDRTRLTAPEPGEHQRDAGHGGDRRADGHDEEVLDRGDRRLVLADEEVHDRSRDCGARGDERQVGAEAAAQQTVHPRVRRPPSRRLERLDVSAAADEAAASPRHTAGRSRSSQARARCR